VGQWALADFKRSGLPRVVWAEVFFPNGRPRDPNCLVACQIMNNRSILNLYRPAIDCKFKQGAWVEMPLPKSLIASREILQILFQGLWITREALKNNFWQD
jgi:hypothetical protein